MENLQKKKIHGNTGKPSWNKGKTGIFSEETLKKMRGRKTTESQRKRISKATKLAMTPEVREKIRKSATGRIMPPRTDAWRLKMHNALTGRKLTGEALRKAGINARLATKRAYQRILKETEDLESQGFVCIPIGQVIPDIIALKDGKIYAFEVEYGKPNYQKYTEEYRKRFDDVVWLLRKNK